MSDYEKVECRVIAESAVEPRHGQENAIAGHVWKRLPAAIAATSLAIGRRLAVYVGSDGAVAYALGPQDWPGMRYLGTYGRGTTEAQVAADLARVRR